MHAPPPPRPQSGILCHMVCVLLRVQSLDEQHQPQLGVLEMQVLQSVVLSRLEDPMQTEAGER